MKSKFSNSVVLATGAGSGIGQQTAIQAAQRGSHVIGADINEKGLEETRAKAATQGLPIETRRLDVSQAPDIEVFAAEVLPTLNNRFLILINNAGVGLFSGKFQDTALHDFEWLININLWGVIRMTKAFFPYLIERNEGHIVNISSIFGLGGVSFQTAYCTSKFGVRGFTEALRMELKGTGIGTTCVHPGGIKTNIVRNASPKGNFTTAEMHSKAIKQFDKNALTTPARAARLILEAVEKRQERLVIGVDGKMADLVTRLFPVSYTRLVKNKVESVFTNPYKELNRNATFKSQLK